MGKRAGMSLVAFVLLFAVISGTALGGESYINKKVTAVYRGIKIVVDGRRLQAPVEPFILKNNNVAMVPLRTVAEAVGKPVDWDPATSTIYIGRKGKSSVPDKPSRYDYLENLTVLRNVGDFACITSREVRIAREPFKHVVAVTLESEAAAEFVLELWGKYSRMEGYLGIDDVTRDSSSCVDFTILKGEEVLYRSETIKPADPPRQLQVDIPRGTRKLTFRVESRDLGIGDYRKITFALADVKFYE